MTLRLNQHFSSWQTRMSPSACLRRRARGTDRGQATYPGAHAAAAGGDLEVPVEVLDGARGEEALHHQQDAVHEEGRCHAVDHVLEDVDPAGEDSDRCQQLRTAALRAGVSASQLAE